MLLLRSLCVTLSEVYPPSVTADFHCKIWQANTFIVVGVTSMTGSTMSLHVNPLLLTSISIRDAQTTDMQVFRDMESQQLQVTYYLKYITNICQW